MRAFSFAEHRKAPEAVDKRMLSKVANKIEGLTVSDLNSFRDGRTDQAGTAILLGKSSWKIGRFMY